ncbi:hypothetical protein BU23DRAFT_453362 [Bimuria novae-zelandiae CBS 107.79]|uniref:Uncharacterized protein n=1 Tax=Bimuria novae-zelandiae CBS 107.79 TaxID=1447943 RepID=A0A6A5VKI5_9PLEO|nr:hypothetical protein BU23DRAFT_453362 [Bimuria novae-zelandiae CBS 107.79]
MPGRCVSRVTPCVRRSHQAPRRAYVTNVLRGDALGPVARDEHQSFRVRKDGSKLPLAPILDPVVVEQRTRWTQMKARPDPTNFTPFQKRLLENPYAHALASPARFDRSTSTLLPSGLLLTLYIKPHPETSDPWLLPLSISTSNAQKPRGPPIRFLAHRHTAAYLGRKKSNWRGAVERRLMALLEPKALEKLIWREDMTELLLRLLQDRVMDKLAWYYSWRGRLTAVPSPSNEHLDSIEDVSCVLFYGSLKTRADELRREAEDIVLDIDKWYLLFRTHFGSYFDPHQNSNLPHAPSRTTHKPPGWYEPPIPRLAARAQFPPLSFSTTKWRGRKVAVYSLTDLLGEENAKQLVGKGVTGEGERCWIIKRARQSVAAEMLLMRLQSYLAEPGAFWEPKAN